MELDNLKEIWKEADAGSTPQKSDQQILEILGKQSNGPVAKMKRNLMYEMYVLLIFYIPITIFYFVKWQGRWSEVGWGYIIIALLFFVYFYFKIRLLNEIQCIACEVKSNLERQVNKLEVYVKRYLIGGTVIPALFILFLGVLLYFKLPMDEPRNNPFLHSPAYAWWQTALVWLVSTIIAGVGIYFLNRKYLRWLYGKHILRLRNLLSQMEEEVHENDKLI